MMRRKAASRSAFDRKPSSRIPRLTLDVGTSLGFHIEVDDIIGRASLRLLIFLIPSEVWSLESTALERSAFSAQTPASIVFFARK